MTQKNCIFCKIINGEIASYKIFEDNYTIAFLDRFPISLGHTLVIPKVHIGRIEELNQKETVALFSTVQKIVGPILHSFDSSSSTIGINDGKDAGQVIPHIHVHIVPRTEGTLGFAMYQPRDNKLDTEAHLNDNMVMALGGRASEYIFYENLSSGAHDDIKRVSQMAY